MQQEMPDDLDWLAFCYIADELSPDEADGFETRLADDQEAREAVARAVHLTRALAAAGAEGRKRTTPASPVSGAWRRLGLAGRLGRLAWAAAATAACLAVVLAYQYGRDAAPTAGSARGGPGEEEVGTPNGCSEELALLWSRTREELAALEHDDWAAGLPDEGEVSDEFRPFSSEDQVLAEGQAEEDALAANVPPSWMLAAVRADAGSPSAEGYGLSTPEEN
jgi:hypothetical protein